MAGISSISVVVLPDGEKPPTRKNMGVVPQNIAWCMFFPDRKRCFMCEMSSIWRRLLPSIWESFPPRGAYIHHERNPFVHEGISVRDAQTMYVKSHMVPDGGNNQSMLDTYRELVINGRGVCAIRDDIVVRLVHE